MKKGNSIKLKIAVINYINITKKSMMKKLDIKS